MTYASEVLADAPAVYFKLDESAGPVANSGSLGGTGTVGSNVQLSQSSAGTIGGAAAHFGNDANSGVTATAKQTYTTSSLFTFDTWFKADLAYGANTGRLFTIYTSAFNYIEITVNMSTGYFRVYDTNGTVNGGVTVPAIVDGGWHHIAVVHNTSSGWTFYVDGVSAGTITGGIAARTSASLCVGTNAASTLAICYLDEPALYNTALSQARITAHYNAGVAVASTSVTATPPALTASLAAPNASVATYTPVSINVAAPAMTLSLATPNAIAVQGQTLVGSSEYSGYSTSVGGGYFWGGSPRNHYQAGFGSFTVPTGKQISTATLTFTTTTSSGNSSPGATVNYEIRRVTSAFTASAYGASTTTGAIAGSFVSSSTTRTTVDITSLVNTWLANGQSLNELEISYISGLGTGYEGICGITDSGTANRATLNVSYADIPPIPVNVSAPVLTASLTAVAPVVSAVKNTTNAASVAALALTAIDAGVSTQGNVISSVPALSAGVSFTGGTNFNPDYFVTAPAMTVGLVSANPVQRIEYNTVSDAPVMELSLTNLPATISLTTNRLISAPPMQMNLKWVGIYIEAADRYLTLIPSTVDADDIWYKMNESAGALRATDSVYQSSTGWAQNGYYFGNPTMQVDGPQLRKATHFDGVDDYLIVGPYTQDNKQKSSDDNNIYAEMSGTIEFSFRTTQTDGVVFAAGPGGYASLAHISSTYYSYPVLTGNEMRMEAGQLVLVNKDGTKTKIRQFVADGKWHHIVMSMPSGAQMAGLSVGKNFDGQPPSYVAIDGKPVLVRFGAFGAYAEKWLPYSFMAKGTPTYDTAGVVLPSPDATGFLAADMRDLIVRLNAYLPLPQTQAIYYEWSDSVIVAAQPMTVNLSMPGPFKAKGNVKRMIAVYGLEYGYDSSGDPVDTYYSTLFDFVIENVGRGPNESVHSAPRANSSVLGGVIYPKVRSFRVGEYIVYPVSILGDQMNGGDGYPSSSDGIISSDAVRMSSGRYVDDSTGLPRFINLQQDLAEDIAGFDALTVVNYPWFRPNAFQAENWYASWGPAVPTDGSLNQGSRGLSNIEWSEARDLFRDSIMEAAYAGVNLWIGEWHMAQHCGFIKEVDIHPLGWWHAGGTRPETGIMMTGQSAPNVAAQELDRLHLSETGAVSNTAYYSTGTKKHPAASDEMGKVTKLLGYFGAGGSYFNWIYLTSGGGYLAYPQINAYRKVVAELPGLTDIPTNEIANRVVGWSWDAFKPNGEFEAYDIIKRPNGLQVGDYSWMNIVETQDQTGPLGLSVGRRGHIISARPDGIVGQVITREQEYYYGPDGITVDNEFANNALTIAAEVGTIVRGRPLAGRAFIELMDQGPIVNYLSEDIRKDMWQGNPGKNVSSWDFDTRRAKESMSQSITGTKTQANFHTGQTNFIVVYAYDFQFQVLQTINWASPNWHARGVNWLAQARTLSQGETVNYPAPMTMALTTPKPTFIKSANPTVQVNGSMVLFMETRQPANYRDGSHTEYALAMAVAIELRGIGLSVGVPPIAVDLSMNSPTLDVSRETIPVYLDNDRSITLYLKEEN